jgi:putative DNA primase/helicase
MKKEDQKLTEKNLNVRNVDKVSKIENGNILVHDPTLYVTNMYKSMMKNKPLFELINNIPEIDFTICFMRENGEEEDYNNVMELLETINNSGNPGKKASARKELKKFEPKTPEKITLIINNLLLVSQNTSTEIGTRNYCYYYYNSDKGYWVLLQKEEIECLLSTAANRSGMTKLKSESTLMIKKLVEQFIQSSVIPIPTRHGPEESDETKINLKNGTFVIGKDSQTLLDFDRKDFFTYVLPFDYNPEATCPLFYKFLNKVIPDQKTQLVMAEYIGYIFNKRLNLEKCMVLIGGGQNGKSVFFKIITALLGSENVSSYSLSNLSDNNGYYRAKLDQVLLNYSSELGGKNCNPDIVKQLISNEPVGARSIYGVPFIISNYCRLLFNANILPKNSEKSFAYFRRFIFVEFDVTISKEEKDPDLARKIIESELSGVFNWVLEGLRRLQRQRDFTSSEKIENALDKAWKESDNTALYMEDRGYRPSTRHQTLINLYSDYKVFCIENGYGQVSNIEFKRRLILQKFTVESKKTNNATWVYCDNSTHEQHSSHQETMDLFSKFAAGSTKN